MVILEKFDHSKFNHEKCSFWIDNNVYNISEGIFKTHGDDSLRRSPLWRYHFSNTELRVKLWKEIKQNLPKYLNNSAEDFYRTRYFVYLIRMAEKVADGKEVKLLYLSDFDHALLIKRCVEWLAEQIVF